DERRLHAGQHVLHPAEVDVAGERGVLRLGDVVLDEDVVLEDGDLRAVAALADDHRAVHGLAAGEELGLGEDRCAAAAGVAAVPAALPLGLQPGGAGDPADVVVAGEPPAAAGPLGTVVVVGVLGAVLRAATTTAPPAAGARTGLDVVALGLVGGGLLRAL